MGTRGRTGKVALVGGAGLLAWILMQGRGWGSGRGKGRPGARVRLEVSETGVAADGEPATVAEAVDLARAVGRAEVVATGAARSGTVAELLAALGAAGVIVYAQPDVWSTLGAHHG